MCLLNSSYPDHRVKKDDKDLEEGVAGSVSLLQNVTVSSQPICSMDWSSDKVANTISGAYEPPEGSIQLRRMVFEVKAFSAFRIRTYA